MGLRANNPFFSHGKSISIKYHLKPSTYPVTAQRKGYTPNYSNFQTVHNSPDIGETTLIPTTFKSNMSYTLLFKKSFSVVYAVSEETNMQKI